MEKLRLAQPGHIRRLPERHLPLSVEADGKMQRRPRHSETLLDGCRKDDLHDTLSLPHAVAERNLVPACSDVRFVVEEFKSRNSVSRCKTCYLVATFDNDYSRFLRFTALLARELASGSENRGVEAS